MDFGWIEGLFVAELVAAIFAAELRDLRWATCALALHSLLLVAIIAGFGYLSGSHALYWWAVTAFILKGFLIPLLLWVYVRRMPTAEVRPTVGLIPSIVGMAVVLPATFYCAYTYLYHPHLKEYVSPVYQGIANDAGVNLGLGLTLFALGIYVILVRRDIVKAVIGLVILENGVHLTLVSLAPNLEEAAEIGMACILVVASWLLLYLAINIHKLWGTRDSTSLSELKW
jgi:hydrogenase-4 membrane subunit HyfE